MKGEFLGGKGMGAGGQAHPARASEGGGPPGARLATTLLPPCPVDVQGRPACPVPTWGGSLGGGAWGRGVGSQRVYILHEAVAPTLMRS